MAEKLLANLPTLTKETYQRWKFDIEAALESNDLLGIVNGKRVLPNAEDVNKVSEWKRADAKARLVISSSLDDEHHASIRSCKTAKEMWDKVRTLREQSTVANKYLLQQEFHQYKFTPEMNVSTYISGLQVIQQKLHNIDEEVTNAMIIAKIINDLPKQFDFFRQSYRISAAAGNALDLASIHAQLLVVEQEGNSKENDSQDAGEAFVSRIKERKTPKYRKETRECFNCGLKGHLIKDCRKPKRNKQKNKPELKGLVSFVDSHRMNNCHLFIADSGATSHMVKNKEFFDTLEELEKPLMITIGDGTQMCARGKGTIKVKVYNGKYWADQVLLNVLWIPTMTNTNLFSLESVTRRGYTVEINDNILKIKDSNRTVLIGQRNCNNLFSLMIQVEFQQTNVATESLQLWHERLGHVSTKTVIKMAKSNVVLGLEKVDSNDNFFCDACTMGKMCKLPYTSRENRSNQVGSIIHTDVCGKMETKSLSQSQYCIVFKDEASGYRKLYFMKTKDETINKIKQFVIEQQAETNRTMKVLRSDNGTEYTNKEVQDFLRDKGIKHETSTPYNPQQNGFVERENRSLVELARSMIFGKKLPKELWAEAMNTAAYVLNRVLNCDSKITPYELWHNKKPSIAHLRVFGTKCYAYIPKEFRKKWEAKAKKLILVGYTNTDKNYRLWDPVKRRVDIHRNIRFDETSELNTNICTEIFKEHYEDPPVDEDEITTLKRDSLQKEIDTKLDENSEESENRNDDLVNETEFDTNTEKDNQKKRGRPLGSKNKIYQSVPRTLRSSTSTNSESNNSCFAAKIIPQNYEEALRSCEAENWINAMDDEYKSLINNNTWTLIDLPEDKTALECRWVYRIKEKSDGTIDRYKARLVIKGYQQKAGIDYKDTFAPVVKMDSIRLILSLVAQFDMEMMHFDTKTAFLHGELKEEVYMKQPEGFKDNTNKVCRLQKGLYGLKQAPRSWNAKINNLLKKYGLKRSKSDTCIYYSMTEETKTILGLYVDDGILCSTDKNVVESILKYLKEEFEIHTEDANVFVGLQIERNRKRGTVKVHQEAYIRKILEKFNMSECKTVSTPADVNLKLCKSTSEPHSMPLYKEAVGSLMYAMIGTRPDIAFICSKLSQYMDANDESHWTAIKRVLRYLKGTAKSGIVFNKINNNSQVLLGYCDADYAGDLNTRKSTSGYIFTLNGGAIAWSSKIQKTIAMSTTEAEYVSMAESVKEAIWLSSLLQELGFNVEPIPIHCDNQGAIKLVSNPEFHYRTKHIDVKYHFIREAKAEGRINVKYVKTEDQPADMLTKPLHGPKLNHCVKRINFTE